jgi:hypothetical protein
MFQFISILLLLLLDAIHVTHSRQRHDKTKTSSPTVAPYFSIENINTCKDELSSIYGYCGTNDVTFPIVSHDCCHTFQQFAVHNHCSCLFIIRLLMGATKAITADGRVGRLDIMTRVLTSSCDVYGLSKDNLTVACH